MNPETLEGLWVKLLSSELLKDTPENFIKTIIDKANTLVEKKKAQKPQESNEKDSRDKEIFYMQFAIQDLKAKFPEFKLKH